MSIIKKRILQFLAFLIILYLVLLIPDFGDTKPIFKGGAKPFTWAKDQLWKQLENDFVKAKQLTPYQLDSAIAFLKLKAAGSFFMPV